jgi:hypothetical protein
MTWDYSEINPFNENTAGWPIVAVQSVSIGAMPENCAVELAGLG